MTRGQEVVSKLMELQKVISDLNPLLSSERVSLEMVRGDIEALEMKKKKLLEENTAIEASNSMSKETGKRILATYKEKAEELHSAANERNITSMQMLESVKQFVEDVDKKRYKELVENVSK